MKVLVKDGKLITLEGGGNSASSSTVTRENRQSINGIRKSNNHT